MHGDHDNITLTKEGMDVKFDMKIHGNRGAVCAACMQRNVVTEAGAVAAEMPTEDLKMSVKVAHGKFGHPSEELTRKIAKALGHTMARGNLGPCEDCAISKSKQKNIPKESDMPKATKKEN